MSVLDGLYSSWQTPHMPQQFAMKPPASTFVPEDETRDFSDPTRVRDLIYSNVLKAASTIEPVSNAKHRLELSDVHYADDKKYTLKQQKQAILGGETLSRRLRGTWRLYDKLTNNIVDEKLATLASVPHMTERGTFILGGNEYSLSNQMRLRPGVFTRIKENGEIESHVNIMPGKGLSHRYFLDPATGVFKINIGQSKVPVIPILRAFGATDKELREHWGDKLFAANASKDDPTIIDKVYAKLLRRGTATSVDDKKKQLVEALTKMELDPEVTKRTLGRPYNKLTKEAILDTTKKLLAVSRGESEPDDRDHLAFQTFMGPEDLISERIGKDKASVRQILWKSFIRNNLQHIQPGIFTKALNHAILGSGLGQPLEEINPTDIFDQQGRVSRLGEGGITSNDSIPDECYDSATEVFTSTGWVNWQEVDENTKFACLINNRLEYHPATRLIVKPYKGAMYGLKTRTLDQLVTPNHRLWCRKYRGPFTVKRIGLAPFEFELAKDAHKHPREFLIACEPYIGKELTDFDVPCPDNVKKRYDPFDINDWAELLGWYVSEGSVDTYALRTFGKYRLTITQSSAVNKPKVERIAALLTRMGIKYSYQALNFCFISKQLGRYLHGLGIGSINKSLPECVFEWPVSARRRLLESLLLGDGHTSDNGHSVYCSVSSKLITQVVRLAGTLGIPARERRPYNRHKPNHEFALSCSLLTSKTQGITDKRHYDNYYTAEYDGFVYCAEVPGEKLLVRRNLSVPTWSGNSRSVHPSQLGFVDVTRSPESASVGIDNRLAHKVRKAPDGKLYAPMINVQTGKTEYKTPQDLSNMVLAFPGEMKSNKPVVATISRGRTTFAPRDSVHYELPDMEGIFSPLANMVPGKSAVKAQRVSMGARFISQSLPLRDAESPHVQSAMPDGSGQSFEEHYGKHMGAVRASIGGKVTAVSNDEIRVQQDDGAEKEYQLYNTFPYNRKTQINSTAMVRLGDEVKPGQLIAKSNYTDAAGTTALGKNARVAYIPFKGLNYEDAYVISEGFAKRMSSEHMYQHEHEWLPTMKKGKNTYISLFPAKYDKKILEKMDDEGTVKEGQTVEYGEPLVLAIQEKEPSFTQVHRGRGLSYSDKTVIWDHHEPGYVTDVAKTKKGVTVAVRMYAPMQIGDKLSGRYGDKGVLASIIPDSEMPHGEDGLPYEVLANPLGVVSRTNPIQMVEGALGKIAAITGKKYKIEDFKNIPDMTQYAIDELNKHGMKDLETLTDPKSGRKIPNVFTGNRFMLKLHHTSSSKGQGRGLAGYTSENIPAKGGPEGSKRIGLLDSSALLSLGATEVLRDAGAVRGQRDDNYWQMFMSGFRPPEPKIPFVYRKFIAGLQASGINPVRKGGQIHIMALTDKDVDKLTEGRYLSNAETVDWKQGLRPIRGGLFDPLLTGGHGSESKWAAIKLTEPMPNPVFEEPIRRLLGLTQKNFEDVISGKSGLGKDGKLYEPTKLDNIFGYGSGPTAVQAALKAINVDKSIANAKAEIAGSRKTTRDAAIRKLGYLKACKEKNIHPGDWMLSKVPVLPPSFRPVSVLSTTKAQMVADSNYLYKELFDANKNLADIKEHLDDVSEERLTLYNAFKGVTGLGDPVHPKNQERKVQGILRGIFGNSPKFGVVQSKLLGSTVDLVGRAVITPNPDLDMDHVGLPESRAWAVYSPFIVRRLVRRGMPRLQAAKAVKDRHAIARDAMMEEMADRPVIINRAPVLHRYGIMASWPILTKGDVLQISPIVTKGFGADFDGDAMQYHVPATDEARDEAIVKMLPSRNLFAVSTFKAHYLPSQEYVGGLYAASTKKDATKKPRTFDNVKSAIAAFERGEINVDHPIDVLNH